MSADRAQPGPGSKQSASRPGGSTWGEQDLRSSSMGSVHTSADPAAWPFDISATAVELFEVLPKELSGHGVGVEFAGDHLGKK